MQKNNVNVIVFDQDQSFMTEQSRVNYHANHRPSTYDAFGGSQAQSIISVELGQLNQKINILQQKAIKIHQVLKSANKSNSDTDLGSSANNSSSNNYAQIQQLFRIVELKIQVVVQETKKIIQKMTNQFDKKISKSASQKNHEINSITKIQTHCRETIAKVEKNYQDQLNVIRNEHIHLQKRLIQKVEELENSYKRKLKDFQNKQQQYVATIQHLQNKLKLNGKSKKMIEVTQDKPASSIKTQAAQNHSILNSQQHFASSGGLPGCDTSKRRTKIFQGRSSNKSISPNNSTNQVLSPIKPQNNYKNQTKSLAKDVNLNQQNFVKNKEIGPTNNNYVLDPRTIHNQQFPLNHTTQNKPVVRFTTNMSEEQRNEIERKKNVVDASSKQFFKDAPKIHWERFQDFNENQSSGDEEDVFFYPEHNRKQEPQSVFDQSHNQSSMHSPFDLN